jgi:hypothetical protein
MVSKNKEGTYKLWTKAICHVEFVFGLNTTLRITIFNLEMYLPLLMLGPVVLVAKVLIVVMIQSFS